MKTDIQVRSVATFRWFKKGSCQFQVKVWAKSTVLYPYYTQGPNPTNRHELTNIWIRGLKRTQFAKILIITESYNL